SYQYDCNGNMWQRVESGVTYTQNFDIENRLASVQTVTGTTSFVYDADGARVMQSQPGGKTIAYVGNLLEVEVQPTATPTNPPTNTPTATNTPTPTATNTPVAGSFCPTVLDNFNRANGTIGVNWNGATGGYSIASNQLDVGGGGDIFWNPTSFGATQDVCVTLTTVDTSTSEIGLILKAQSNSNRDPGLIEVSYNPYNGTDGQVEVWTWQDTVGWVHRGNVVTGFANGDRFGARATAAGQVEVYKNGVLLGSKSVTAWPYYANSGYIGIWMAGNGSASDAVLDDFGGGTVGGPTPTPTNTPTNTPVGPTNTPTPTPTNTPSPTPTNTSSGCPTSDDFNRANSTNLGANWTERAGDLEINTNLLRNVSTATDNIATICGTYSNVLVSSQVQIASGSGSVSVGARLGGYSGGIPSQGYTAELTSNGTVYLYRVDTWQLLGQGSISFSTGTWYTLALRANGSSLSVEVDGNTIVGPVTNAAFTSGDAGVWSYAPSSAGSHRFDNFSITVLGGGHYTKVKGLAMVDARRIRALPSAPPTNTTYRVYYHANGKPIAMREMPTGDNTGTLYYLHSDHLGSTSVTTCGSGACGTAGTVVARQWYEPFGKVRASSGTLPTKRTYTGQYTEEPGLGSLMFYNARYFSPALGRFVSADSIVPDETNPQAWNRYAYTLGNPLKYTDPSGHSAGCGDNCPWNWSMNITSWGPVGINLAAVGCLFISCQVVGVNDNFLSDPYGGEWYMQSVPTLPMPMAIQFSGLEPALTSKVTAARQAQGIVGTTVGEGYTLASTADGAIITHSGTNQRQMMTQGTRQAMELADEIGFRFPKAGFWDNGVPGQWHASHAEAQMAALVPDQPVGVSNHMCSTCQKFYSAIANHRGVPQVVADPARVRIFHPGGGITTMKVK
ncbi:MAG: RHS repeat-associated core domain-containing protein, partial [Anaerolineales bacterium]